MYADWLKFMRIRRVLPRKQYFKSLLEAAYKIVKNSLLVQESRQNQWVLQAVQLTSIGNLSFTPAAGKADGAVKNCEVYRNQWISVLFSYEAETLFSFLTENTFVTGI